jgi:hypothetical protein
MVQFFNIPADATYRAVTGGPYNFPSSYYGIPASGTAFPVKGTIPVAQPKDGTFISQGVKVRGIGTRFLNDVYTGDFIYAKDVIRRVKYVETNEMLTLDQPFPTDVTVAIQPFITRGSYMASTVKNTHASADSIVNEAPLNFGSQISPLAPISYDATGSELEITVSK